MSEPSTQRLRGPCSGSLPGRSRAVARLRNYEAAPVIACLAVWVAGCDCSEVVGSELQGDGEPFGRQGQSFEDVEVLLSGR